MRRFRRRFSFKRRQQPGRIKKKVILYYSTRTRSRFYRPRLRRRSRAGFRRLRRF